MEYVAVFDPKKNKQKKLRIFGKKFVEANKNKCKIKYQDKSYEIEEYLDDIIGDYNHVDEIKLTLIFSINNIIDMSYMFENCNCLVSFCKSLENPSHENNIHNQQTQENSQIHSNNSNNLNNNMENTNLRIKDMAYMFCGCVFLKEIKGISDWDTSEVTNMKSLFYNCISLETLPDKLNWNRNIT